MLSPACVPLGIAIAICLVCAAAGGSVPHRYFQEWQPATLYNATQLVLCAVVAAAIAATYRSKWATRRSVVLFWSVVCAVCTYCAVDELFQFHEGPGPIAQALRLFSGQPGPYFMLDGQKVISFGSLVQFSYLLIAAAIALPFRREILMHSASVWLFALAATFLTGSLVLDFGMIDGHHLWLDPSGAISDGVFQTLAESLKVAGFAMVLGGLMETLLAKRQLISVEKMLSQLNQTKTNNQSSAIKSSV